MSGVVLEHVNLEAGGMTVMTLIWEVLHKEASMFYTLLEFSGQFSEKKTTARLSFLLAPKQQTSIPT